MKYAYGAVVSCVAFLSFSCTIPTPSTTKGAEYSYNMTASINGASFGSGARVTISKVPNTSQYQITINGVAASPAQSIGISFYCPVTVAVAETLRSGDPGYVVGTYGDPDGATWTSADSVNSAVAIVSSFQTDPGDTVIAVDFSFKAWKPNDLTGTTISAGTVRKK